MAEDKLKPKSFRIDDETAEKIKTITTEIGGNQQAALAKMIEAYEFQRGKVILTERADDIDRFEKLVTNVTRMYMDVLEDNQNITDSVRAEFEALLQSKDSTIQDLQERVKSITEIKEKAVNDSTNYKKANDDLNQRLASLQKKFEDEAENYKKILIDKEQLNTVLMEANRDQKIQYENIMDEVAEAKKIKTGYEELKDQLKELTLQNAHLQESLTSIEKVNADKLEEIMKVEAYQKKQDLFDLKQKYENEIQDLKKANQSEIDGYQKRYLQLLERFQNQTEQTQ